MSRHAINRDRSGIASFLRRNGAALLLTGGLFALVYAIVFNFRTGDSDYIDHLLWALAMSPEDIAASFYDGSERLWHICVKFLFTHGVSNMWSAAALVTAAADAAACFLVFKFLDKTVPEKISRSLLAVLTAAVFLVNALTLPGGIIYSTKGAVNTWQNPTNIMVRPFACAVFFMTVQIYNRRRFGQAAAGRNAVGGFAFDGGFLAQFKVPVYKWYEIILYPLCLLLSTYAKPSFLQFFGPAILIFLLIDVVRTKGKLLPFCIKLALAYIPAAVILLSQFFSFFGAGLSSAAGTGGGEAVSSGAAIAVYFLREQFSGPGDFLRAAGDALMGLVYLCAFPLAVLLADARRSFRSAEGRLGFICLITAWLESLLLHETGARAAHGNLLWGFYLSTWVLWSAVMGRYAALAAERSTAGKLVRRVGTPLLVWHLTVGVVYVIRILQTGLYYY